MQPDPKAVQSAVRTPNPDLANLPEAGRIYAEILAALAGSQRSPEEMTEAVAVLDPLAEARARVKDPTEIDLLAGRILKAAQGVRDGKSGMAVDLSLDHLHLAFDEARKLTNGTAE